MNSFSKVLKSGHFNLKTELILCDKFDSQPEGTIDECSDELIYVTDEDQKDLELERLKQDARQEGFKCGFLEGKEKGYQSGYLEGKQMGSEVGCLEGKKEGYEAGYKDGQLKAMTEGKALIAEADALLGRLRERQEEVVLAAQKEVLELALMIAEKIIDREVSMDKNTVLRTVQKGLRNISEREGLVIRVSSEDVVMLKEADLLEFGVTKSKIIEDQALKAGDCIIDCRQGRVDATLKNQFKMVTRKLGVASGG